MFGSPAPPSAARRPVAPRRARREALPIEQAWGRTRPTPKELNELIDKTRASLHEAPASFARGRLVFENTCGKCHKGANEKFIPAITHKRPGPIPHYAEKGLMLLVIGVFAFIISHVLLEAMSDIRDSVFRKGREEE